VSNPIGQDTVNLSVNLPLTLYNDIKALAAANQMKLGPYVRLVLLEAQKAKLQFDINISTRTIEKLLSPVNSSATAAHLNEIVASAGAAARGEPNKPPAKAHPVKYRVARAAKKKLPVAPPPKHDA
jgi:hypothetical protein